MRWGRLIAVVGPSGAGKDTVLAALAQARPDIYRVQRVITRPSDPEGEPFESVCEAEFAARLKEGAFALHWQAHGLRYGIPSSLHARLAEGRDAMVNLSRSVLPVAAVAFGGLHVFNITASDDIRAMRLARRGRETPDDIAARIARVAPPLSASLSVTHIDNSGSLEQSVAACLAALDPEQV